MGDSPDPKAHGKKSDKTTVNQRVKEIVDLKLQGGTRSHIFQHASDEGWDLSDRMVDELIKKATDQLQEINSENIKATQATIVAAMWKVYRLASKIGNITEMRLTLQGIAKVMGLEESTVNHVIRDEQLQELDDVELDRLLGRTKGNEVRIQ